MQKRVMHVLKAFSSKRSMIRVVNPFQYGGMVGPDAFCNRTEELRELTRAATNAERLFVYSYH